MKLTEQQLDTQLRGLSAMQKAMFGASCCERLLPNYDKFASEAQWGNREVLRSALEFIWLAIEEDAFDVIDPTRVDAMIASCESATPDTDRFRSKFTSSALDAATSVIELLQFLIDHSLQHILDISTLSLDSVDMYIQELLNIDYLDTDFESKIRNHPLMIKEVHKQMSDFSFLKNCPVIDQKSIAFFRNQRSNLEI